MASESPQEFRRYRITLGAVVFGLTTLAVIWLASSVAVALVARPEAIVDPGAAVEAPPAPQASHEGQPAAPTRFSGRADDRAGMLRCQTELADLLARLRALAGRIAATEDGPAVEAFNQAWPRRWRLVGEQCRFQELRDRGLGAAFDHLAWVHAELAEVHRGMRAHLGRYLADVEPRVGGLGRALEESRRTLERGLDGRGDAPAR